MEYPYLAYKSYQPQNNKVIVLNMQYDQMIDEIDLGEWEFFCFVGHTQKVDTRIFREKFERTCHIMMIIRKGLKYRLIDVQYNPFLALNERGKRVIKFKKEELKGEPDEVIRLNRHFALRRLHVCNTEFSIGYYNSGDFMYLSRNSKRFNSDKF